MMVSVWAAVAGAAATAATPAPAGNVEPALDPANGEVAVVAAGAPVDGRIAVIVQNGTAEPVGSVRVTAVATTADGSRSTKVSTRSLLPSTLAPGAIALAALGFEAADVEPGSTLTYELSSGSAGSVGDRTSLEIGSLSLSAPRAGDVAQTLELTVTNPMSRAIKGPIHVRVMCFGEARRPAIAVDSRIKRAKLAADASVSTTVELRELCPSYLVAARGRSGG
jgi:hypothetical protein